MLPPGTSAAVMIATHPSFRPDQSIYSIAQPRTPLPLLVEAMAAQGARPPRSNWRDWVDIDVLMKALRYAKVAAAAIKELPYIVGEISGWLSHLRTSQLARTEKPAAEAT